MCKSLPISGGLSRLLALGVCGLLATLMLAAKRNGQVPIFGRSRAMTKLIPALALVVGLLSPDPTEAQGRDGGKGRPDSPPGQTTRGPSPSSGSGQGPVASGLQAGSRDDPEGARASEGPLCPQGVIPHPAECQCPSDQRPEPLMRTLGDVDYRCPES